MLTQTTRSQRSLKQPPPYTSLSLVPPGTLQATTVADAPVAPYGSPSSSRSLVSDFTSLGSANGYVNTSPIGSAIGSADANPNADPNATPNDSVDTPSREVKIVSPTDSADTTSYGSSIGTHSSTSSVGSYSTPVVPTGRLMSSQCSDVDPTPPPPLAEARLTHALSSFSSVATLPGDSVATLPAETEYNSTLDNSTLDKSSIINKSTSTKSKPKVINSILSLSDDIRLSVYSLWSGKHIRIKDIVTQINSEFGIKINSSLVNEIIDFYKTHPSELEDLRESALGSDIESNTKTNNSISLSKVTSSKSKSNLTQKEKYLGSKLDRMDELLSMLKERKLSITRNDIVTRCYAIETTPTFNDDQKWSVSDLIDFLNSPNSPSEIENISTLFNAFYSRPR